MTTHDILKTLNTNKPKNMRVVKEDLSVEFEVYVLFFSLITTFILLMIVL